MADFVAVIRKAVDNLPVNTAETRAKVYDKARGAIRRQLEAINPRPADEVIARQLDKLNGAVDEVEAEHAEALPAPDDTESLMAELEALVQASPPPAFVVPRPVAPPVPPKPAPVAAAASTVPDVASMRKSEAERADPEADIKPPFISGEAHDDAFGLNVPRGPLRRAPPPHKARVRKGIGKGLLIGLGLILLLAGAGYAAFTERETLTALLWGPEPVATGETEAPVAPQTPASPETAEPAASIPQPPAETRTAAAPPPSSTPKTGGKFTQRLNSDGTETDPGPAPDAPEIAAIEGRSVAEITDPGPVDTGDPATTAPARIPELGPTPDPTLVAPQDLAADGSIQAPDPAADPAATPTGAPAETPATATPAAATAAIGVAQKMYLYEERLDQQTPAVVQGSVVWTLINEPDAQGRQEPAIRGEITEVSNGMSALITITRNADTSLPASHIIEIVFALPPDFSGGSIDQVQRIAMKQTEQDQGNPLIAVPAKITQDFYMIALNDLQEAVSENTTLLRQRNWIDIPLIYGNGRRALITMEKGASGVEVFNAALDAWARL